MKTLVTGSSGFLGSHICEELDSRGHEVVGFDLNPAQEGYLTEFVLGDIQDVDRLATALGGCSAVYNCAAIADLESARSLFRRAVEVNVVGTLSVMEAASRAGVRRFVQASSIYVYSQGGSVYKTTKQAAEGLIEDLSVELNLESTILRF